MKKQYEELELEIFRMDMVDIITGSEEDTDELPDLGGDLDIGDF